VKEMEKTIPSKKIVRLIETIYDDAAKAYKKACKIGDKQKRRECLRRLYFIENQLGKIEEFSVREEKN
jgi:hypothetical protein